MLRPTFPQRAGDAEAGYRTLGTVPPIMPPDMTPRPRPTCAPCWTPCRKHISCPGSSAKGVNSVRNNGPELIEPVDVRGKRWIGRR